MDKLKVIIVDDEAPARANVAMLLKAEADVEVTAICSNGKEAIDQIIALNPEIVFLDIQMPEIDGFEVLKQLKKRYAPGQNFPFIIFATAYDQYALQAFEVNAVDYLLKPFDDQRFLESLNRVRKQMRQDSKGEMEFALGRLLEKIEEQKNKYLDRLSVRQGGVIQLVPVSQLIWVEAENQYVNLHTESRTYLLRISLRELTSRLDPTLFYRVHRSAIVRLESIRSMEPHFKGDYWLHLKDGQKVKLSRNRVDELKKRLHIS